VEPVNPLREGLGALEHRDDVLVVLREVAVEIHEVKVARRVVLVEGDESLVGRVHGDAADGLAEARRAEERLERRGAQRLVHEAHDVKGGRVREGAAPARH
jgi:hypothetical protein